MSMDNSHIGMEHNERKKEFTYDSGSHGLLDSCFASRARYYLGKAMTFISMILHGH